MAVTDLTGYTWVGNDDVTVISAGVRTYNINYSITCDDTQYNSSGGTLLKIDFTQEYYPPWDQERSVAYIEINTDNYDYFGGLFFQGNGRIYESGYGATLPATLHLTGGTSPTYVTSITITGGTDATNPDLIALLEANGTLTPPQPQNITLDLSTLSLPTGTHSIQIRLSDDGLTKRDSELSNAVTYVVAPQLSAPQNPVAITSDGTDFAFEPVENAEKYEVFADGESIGECTPEPEGETWVLNQNFGLATMIDVNISFTSNNQTFSRFATNTSGFSVNKLYYNNTEVWNLMDEWFVLSEDYRTVYFPEPPTGDLRTWLTNNAELQ